MEVIAFVICAFLLLVVFYGSGYMNEKKARDKFKSDLIKNYGKRCNKEYKEGAFSHIAQYAKHHQSRFTLDDITWNDLDMDEIYARMNYAKCSAGEEYLYYMLKNPHIEDVDWTTFEKQVTFFQKNEKDRQALQMALHEMGYTGKYSVYEYLNSLYQVKKPNMLTEYIPNILILLSIAACFVNIGIGLTGVFILIVYNMIRYFKRKAEIDPYITCFAYVFRLLKQTDTLSKVSTPVIANEIEELMEIKKSFRKFAKSSYLLMSPKRMSGDMMEVGIDYLRMFFHLDIIKFYSMLDEVKKHTNEVDAMITIIGKIDALLAIGEFRTYIGDFCIPQFERNAYKAEELYHPLLKNPVKNNVDVKRSMLITGSNASGKSTFLKTVAVNAILAQSIHTVCADSYKGDYFKVYSSISLRDNIFEGDSYYMAEIKSIKRMIEAKEEGIPVLAFVDEVLRGTNTIERIAASSVILKKMAEGTGFCFAATHDVELTHILEEIYENVHFEEIIKEGDISFPYRLIKGRATTRNAIKLLELMDYNKELVVQAKQSAERFEEGGVWEVLA